MSGSVEDHFGFIPEEEIDGHFVLMVRKDHSEQKIALLNSHCLPEGFKTRTNGLILNYPVENVENAYEYYFMEGLTLLGKPALACCGRKNFLIADPNGNLIGISQRLEKHMTEAA